MIDFSILLIKFVIVKEMQKIIQHIVFKDRLQYNLSLPPFPIHEVLSYSIIANYGRSTAGSPEVCSTFNFFSSFCDGFLFQIVHFFSWNVHAKWRAIVVKNHK